MSRVYSSQKMIWAFAAPYKAGEGSATPNIRPLEDGKMLIGHPLHWKQGQVSLSIASNGITAKILYTVINKTRVVLQMQ